MGVVCVGSLPAVSVVRDRAEGVVRSATCLTAERPSTHPAVCGGSGGATVGTLPAQWLDGVLTETIYF